MNVKSLILTFAISAVVALAQLLNGTTALLYILLEQFFIVAGFTLLLLFSYFPVISILKPILQVWAVLLLFFLELSLFFHCFLCFKEVHSSCNSDTHQILLICETLDNLFHIFFETLAEKFESLMTNLF